MMQQPSGMFPMGGVQPQMSMNGTSADGMMAGMDVLGFALPPPMSFYTREEIVAMVDQHETDVQPLRERMDADWERFTLKRHIPLDIKTGQPLVGYPTYTSNAPKVFAEKVMAWLNLAEVLIRAPHMENETHPEEADNLKERFAIGCLAQANERLLRSLQPTMQGATAFYATVRGGMIGGRCLLAKKPDGSTYVDIQPFDPMHVHWRAGPDGLKWVCYKTKMTRAEIKDTYGVDHGVSVSSSTDAAREGVFVYEFYDGAINTVITGSEVLKPPTPHGSPRVPCYMALVGSMPQVQSYQSSTSTIDQLGESIYSSVRGAYDQFNDVMSMVLYLISLSRRQPIQVKSRSGMLTLEGDPHVEGSVLATTDDVEIKTLELLKVAQEWLPFLQILQGEVQRGSLPYSVYGELAFQLSGFAINQLRQGIETVLSGRIAVIKEAVTQMANLLYDQFQTKAFDAIRLSGQDRGRNYFSQSLAPEQIAETCDFRVEVVSQLPEDDMSKWQIAEIAKRTGLMADLDILNDQLKVQDAQQYLDRMYDQKAEQGLPEAVFLRLAKASEARGNRIQAQMYIMAYEVLMAKKYNIMPPTPDGPQQGSDEPQQGPGPVGARSEIMPNAMTGAPPSPQSSNNGPAMVAPGSPRPAAQGQQDQNRQL